MKITKFLNIDIEPAPPEMELQIEMQCRDIMKNNDAQVYWPLYDFNGIGDFIPGQGYQIKMFEAVTVQFPLDTELAAGLALVDQFTEPPIL